MEMELGTPGFVYVELAGALVGGVLIFVLARVTRQMGGEVGAALRYLTVGVAIFTFAFAVSFVVDFFGLGAMQSSMAAHMTLMALAMVMIVFSALRFARLV